MESPLPSDIRELLDSFDASARDAEALGDGLTEERGTERVEAGSWSVSECLDHLATGNRAYLDTMLEPAARARAEERFRQRPAEPGWAGKMFIAMLEPPPKWWSTMKSPRISRPRPAPPLAPTLARYLAVQADFREFLTANADLDLFSIRFTNPFIRSIRFSLATGLHVIATHDRRHLLQAWGVRRALERSAE